MTITREQVADLQPGDVVEYSGHPHLQGAKVIGPLVESRHGGLDVGSYVVRFNDGSAFTDPNIQLTVVSRAPRPLYVNHPRTEPVAGDVVRDGDGQLRIVQRSNEEDKLVLWGFGVLVRDKWLYAEFRDAPKPLRLLVDGETGQVVP